MNAGTANKNAGSNYTAVCGETEYRVNVSPDGAVTLNDEARDVQLQNVGASLYSLLLGAKSFEVFVEAGEGEYSVTVEGEHYRVRVAGERQAEYSRMPAARRPDTRPTAAGDISSGRVSSAGGGAPGAVISPMTGVLVELLVSEGQEVKAGDSVAVLEAMKTRSLIKAPRDGIVSRIQASVGQTIRMDHEILHIEARTG